MDPRRNVFELVGEALDELSRKAEQAERASGFREMLQVDNPTVVWAALQELARAGHPDVLPDIAPLTGHADGTIRQAAAQAIQQIQRRAGITPASPHPVPPAATPAVQVRQRPRGVPPPPPIPPTAVPMRAVSPPPPPPPPLRPASATEMGGAIVSQAPRPRTQRQPAPPPPPPATDRRHNAPVATSRTQEAVHRLLTTTPTEMEGTVISSAPLREVQAATSRAPEQTARQILAGALPPPADLVTTAPEIPPPAPPSLVQPPLPDYAQIPELDWEKMPQS